MIRNRGQTTLDFAIGMGVFLLTVIFVISYAPTMFDPFTGGTGTKLIVADRAATTLSSDLLVTSTADPGVLSAGCVAGFFQGANGNPTRFDDECAAELDSGVDDLDGTLSLDGRSINVTVHELERGGSSDPSPIEISWDGTDIELTRSNSESVPSDIAVATRTVSISGEQYRLTVRVW